MVCSNQPTEDGRPPQAGRATLASHQARSGLGHAEGIPNAVLDHVAFAIKQAECPGREGPYGGYDYGHNPEFYGPEPEGGRYVIRDFRSPRSETWGKWVHQTHCRDEHEQALLRLTGRHIARSAIEAYAQADGNPKGGDAKQAPGESLTARSRSDAPNP